VSVPWLRRSNDFVACDNDRVDQFWKNNTDYEQKINKLKDVDQKTRYRLASFVDVLGSVVNLLNKLNIPFFISHGTLLGTTIINAVRM
jgi:hypothetical protein